MVQGTHPMMNKDWDPYQHLLELAKFAEHADQHIEFLLKNQRVLLDTVNLQHKEIALMNKRLKKMEDKINETTRPQ